MISVLASSYSVSVAAIGSAGTFTAITDGIRSYSINLPEGNYDLAVEMDGYLDAVHNEELCHAGVMNTLPVVTLLAGDSNDDDVINILDLSFMGARFLMSAGDPGFDARADINDDGTINILDLTVAGANFLETSPVAWP